MQLLSELYWIGGGTILFVIWFSFAVSPCQSQINPMQFTDQATFPCKPLHPSKRAFSVIWCSTLLKTEQGGGVWGGEKKGEKPRPRYHHFILIFFPSHSLIPLMKSGQAEACSRRQQFHCTICASHIGWQGGEGSVGSTARRKEKGRKYTTWNPELGHTDTLWFFLSAASDYAALAVCPSYIHHYTNASN